jgi:hypothetical protein
VPRTLERNRPDLVPDRPRTYVASVDILTDILDRVRLKGTVLFHYEFGRPWSVALPRSPDAIFHYLSRGSASIALEDGPRGLVPRWWSKPLKELRATFNTSCQAQLFGDDSARAVIDTVAVFCFIRRKVRRLSQSSRRFRKSTYQYDGISGTRMSDLQDLRRRVSHALFSFAPSI